jgi:hypothetical protein
MYFEKKMKNMSLKHLSTYNAVTVPWITSNHIAHRSFVRWHLLGVLTELWDLVPCTQLKDIYWCYCELRDCHLLILYDFIAAWTWWTKRDQDLQSLSIPHCHALPCTATHCHPPFCLSGMSSMACNIERFDFGSVSAHLHPAGSTPTSCVGSSIRGCTSLNSIFSPCSFTVQRCSKYSTSSQMLFGCDMAFLGFSGRLPFSCVLGWRMKGARMVEDRWAEWQPLN